MSRIKEEILFFEKTDCGSCRQINQDAIASFVNQGCGLFVVSDGMGGHSHGELASREIIAQMNNLWQRFWTEETLPDFHMLVTLVKNELRQANELIYRKYNAEQICGATVVVLLIVKDCYAIFSVGDSKIYQYSNRQLSVMTVDDIWDTLPETVARYTPEEIANHRNRGKLVQAMGIELDVSIHVQTGRLGKKEVFVLCSDGLYKYCDEKVIEKGAKRVYKGKSMEEVSQTFIKSIYENGAKDNISYIIVLYHK